MLHRGEILARVVRKYRPNISALAADMGYDRTTIYRHFGIEDLGDEIILKYAKALKYDFSKEFPELSSYSMILAEPLSEYRPLTMSEALKEIDYWKKKYIDLLERFNARLEENTTLK